MLKFPYGISDFYQVMTENYLYLDRTAQIRLIEEYGKNLLFLRPRRFGKSLLLSTLENYYDVNKAGEFSRLFGELAIGKSPTALHNQYLVMRWDFSMVKAKRHQQELEKALHNHINTRLAIFVEDYKDILQHSVSINPNDAITSFEATLGVVRRTPYRMYLLIDEYDDFANTVLMSDILESREQYEELVQSEGALKAILKAVKGATSGLGLDRVFITGVSPVVMSDITSGHNISESISFLPEFHDLCGFDEAEVTTLLEQVRQRCQLSTKAKEEALVILRAFYDGYSFHLTETQRLYNPTLALYFLKHYQRYCSYPRNMFDGNFAIDRAKIAYVANLPNGFRLIQAALEGKEPLTFYKLEERFGIADMLNESQSSNFFASLLTYLGVLTLGGTDDYGKLILKVPNLVVRKLYVAHLQKTLLPSKEQDRAQQLAELLYKTGEIEPLCDFIEQRYFKVFDNRDYRDAKELTIKTIFLTVLFNDIVYIMDSESALERGYADLTMIVRPEMRKYQYQDILIEFKYLKLGEAKVTGEQVRKMNREQVAALEEVKNKLTEATSQVKKYSQGLQNKYGEKLRLRTYVVVALGFESIVWQEVTGN